LLLLLYPQASPHTVATISLSVVFVNALSGSLAYARMRRIDYKSGLLFSTATVPGAIVGAHDGAGHRRRREEQARLVVDAPHARVRERAGQRVDEYDAERDGGNGVRRSLRVEQEEQ